MQIDFTKCEVNRFKTYGGANGSKRGIIYNGNTYMLKFPPEAKRNKEISYSNSTVSEYIGCQIYNALQMPVQETILGTFDYNGKIKNVVACKDFESDGYRLKDFASIKNTIIDSVRGGYGTELYNLLETIDEQNLISPIKLKKFFWDMFVVDAFIGNFDRHNGNWGFLINEETHNVKIAPIYDCGSCLFSEMDNDIRKKVMNSKMELEYRVYNIPKSAIMENEKKINYFNFLSSGVNKDATASLFEINNKIDLSTIDKIIDETPIISDFEKSFYKFILKARKEMILEQSIHIILNKSRDIQNKEVEYYKEEMER